LSPLFTNLGLFKSAEMPGVQEPYCEAYYTYVEWCGLQRNPDFIGTDRRIVNPSAFTGKEYDY
jgi:hypothetical protein